MYLVPLKAALVEATRKHFSANYVDTDFANTWISIEFPKAKENYPCVWINFTESGEVAKAGIGHEEIIVSSDGLRVNTVTRWRFQGTVSFSVGAMTSLERDRLYDELVRMIAFAGFEDSNQSSVFKKSIEENDFVGIEMNFDTVHPSGDGAPPGTPWGTDETIYEKTLSTDLLGEFVSNPQTLSLALLSDIQVMGSRFGEKTPPFPDETPSGTNNPVWNPSRWT